VNEKGRSRDTVGLGMHSPGDGIVSLHHLGKLPCARGSDRVVAKVEAR
jgi:hypothetical protein